MLALTGSRIMQAMSSYYRKMGLTPAILRRTSAIIEKALRDGAHLTRNEIGDIIGRARVGTAKGTHLAHMMMKAELDGLVCSGPCRGKQFTYGLLDLRAPAVAPIDRDEALSRLARIYFTGRGPATVHDFAWWSGLTMGDARRGIDIRGKALTAIDVDGKSMWMVTRDKPAPPAEGTAHLLPNYDEYFIGHRDRSAIGKRLKGVHLVTGGDASITHVVIVGGELVGGWKRGTTGGKTTATLSMQVRVARDERALIDAQLARFERFAN